MGYGSRRLSKRVSDLKSDGKLEYNIMSVYRLDVGERPDILTWSIDHKVGETIIAASARIKSRCLYEVSRYAGNEEIFFCLGPLLVYRERREKTDEFSNKNR